MKVLPVLVIAGSLLMRLPADALAQRVAKDTGPRQQAATVDGPPMFMTFKTSDGRTIVPMSPGMARIAIRDLLQSRYLVSLHLPRGDMRMLESSALRITRTSVAFDYRYDEKREQRKDNGAQAVRQQFDLTREKYFGTADGADQNGSFTRVLPSGTKFDPYERFANVLAWKERSDAQRFCDAINRLIFAARTGEPTPGDLSPQFVAAAKVWREVPESRLSVPADAQRERVLAEAAYKENDHFMALAHYEAAVLVNPLWPEGWFNAALLYEALGDYPYAANRMKHYLELMPNAPDAGAARDKVIVWEAKGQQQ